MKACHTSAEPLSKDRPLALGVLLTSAPQCNQSTAACLRSPHAPSTTTILLLHLPKAPVVNRLVGLGVAVPVSRSPRAETLRRGGAGEGRNRTLGAAGLERGKELPVPSL